MRQLPRRAWLGPRCSAAARATLSALRGQDQQKHCTGSRRCWRRRGAGPGYHRWHQAQNNLKSQATWKRILYHWTRLTGICKGQKASTSIPENLMYQFAWKRILRFQSLNEESKPKCASCYKPPCASDHKLQCPTLLRSAYPCKGNRDRINLMWQCDGTQLLDFWTSNAEGLHLFNITFSNLYCRRLRVALQPAEPIWTEIWTIRISWDIPTHPTYPDLSWLIRSIYIPVSACMSWYLPVSACMNQISASGYARGTPLKLSVRLPGCLWCCAAHRHIPIPSPVKWSKDFENKINWVAFSTWTAWALKKIKLGAQLEQQSESHRSESE